MNDQYFYKDGTTSDELDSDKVLHRLDGPACIEDGFAEAWFKDGVRHRDNGPAVIYKNGKKEWWVNGKRLPDQE
ncbi:hypothetical protein [Pseudobacteriovorax antillogorgiicola]|uniref:MORN repeat variant n=1 Tax=Pseudobacteriovorax antillogorgiicola TaxID=1513793 RepID=A0A1Y6BET5_9BACT|nr:hypothetical protein [Pseudobacteriovorax antillogorgiicola]TCS56413.1 hypothetical protein EDD56_104235 [Pseudobacteriovorax antillogorgiicola]SMF05812.1 hypothetical protein SAMN06296036_10498 [Pseudobacteriovorax antillogorgiicola]